MIFRYEHKHQFAKSVARIMKNFRNPALTIHQRHQKLVAAYQHENQVDSINYFENHSRTHSPLLRNLPYECDQIPASQQPFSTKKNILRKLKMRNDLYLCPSAFYKLNDEVFVTGKVLRKKLDSNHRRSAQFVKSGNLYQLEDCYDSEMYIKLCDLHFSNDFLYYNNNLMYLLEWIQ